MKMLLAVAAGGALGAMARYGLYVLGAQLYGHGFLWSALIVNLLGSFILAILVEVMALKWSPSQEVRALLVVGVLGSFTTFSAFSLDVVTLVQRHAWTPAMLYVVGSVALSVGAFLLGLRLTRLVIAG